MKELKPLFDGPFDCLTHVFGTDSDDGAAGPAAVPNGARARAQPVAYSTIIAAPLHGATGAAPAGPPSDPADYACATPDDRIALACLRFVQRERAEKKEVLSAPGTPCHTYADLTPADPPGDAADAATCRTVAPQLPGVAPAAPPCHPAASAVSSERTEDLGPQAAAHMAASYDCAHTSPTTRLPSAAGAEPVALSHSRPRKSTSVTRQRVAQADPGSRVLQDAPLAAGPVLEPFDAAIATLGAMHPADAHADAERLPGASRRSKRSRAPVDYSGACTGSVAAAPRSRLVQAAAGAAAAQKALTASSRGPAGGQRPAQQASADVGRATHARQMDYCVDLQLSPTVREATLAAAQALAAQLDKDSHTFPLVKVAY